MNEPGTIIGNNVSNIDISCAFGDELIFINNFEVYWRFKIVLSFQNPND